MSDEKLPHLLVDGFFATERYTAVGRRGADFPLPARDRTAHGTSVREQLIKMRGENEQNRGAPVDPDTPAPITIKARTDPAFLRNPEGQENRSRGPVLANVRVRRCARIDFSRLWACAIAA